MNHKETLLKGKEEYLHNKKIKNKLRNNEMLWKIEDFIKDVYLESGIDNFQFGTIANHFGIKTEEVLSLSIKLIENGKIDHQYDIRDTDLRLLDSSNTIQRAIDIANRLFDEKDNLFDRIYVSIKLTKDYKEILNKTKKV